MRGEARLDALQVRLFDYAIANDGPLRIVLEKQRVDIDRLRLIGEGRCIEFAGGARLDTEQLDLRDAR